MSDRGPAGTAGRAAVLLAVGTELTEGVILNTHFRFLGAALTSRGFLVRWAVQIPDEADLFARTLRQALADAELVLISGGLGPTSDDLTREVAAEVCGAPLEFHPDIWEALRARWAGQPIAETNRKQAYIPRGFTVLPNPHGTAPGFCGQVGRALLAALPGPPRELEPMFLERLGPLLPLPAAQEGELSATALLVPESQLEQALQRCQQEPGGASPAGQSGAVVRWGTRFAEDRIAFSLRGGDAAARQQLFQALQREFGTMRVRLGDCAPNSLLHEALRARGKTLALAESCTGGLVGKWLTDLPGASDVFWGGLTVYSNAAKRRLLGVSGRLLLRRGAVSAEAAEAMARQLLRRSPADVGLAVTGIAGPAGGSAEKPVGTVWIAASARGGGRLCRSFRFGGARDAVRRRAAVAAMLLAEGLLVGADPAALDALGSGG